MSSSNDFVLTLVAVEVGKHKHGAFVTSMARAWSMADLKNRSLIRTAWSNVIDSYKLREVYSKEIEERLPEYLTEET